MPGMRYQPQGRAKVDRNIAADFGWLAPAGASVIGPAATMRSSRIGTSAGLAMNSGYASLAGRVSSMHTTTWTESGVVWLNGTDEVVTLSARATGQAVAFQPSLNRVNLVMWGVTDVLISGGVLPTGPIHYVARRSGSQHTVWINGKLYGSATSSQSPIAFSASTLPAVGARAFSGAYAGTNPLLATTGILSLVRTPLALADEQCIALSRNHWAAWSSPEEDEYQLVAAAGTSVTPGVAGVSAIGYTPSVVQGAARDVALGASAVALTGYAPTVSQGAARTAAPGAAVMSVAGFVPTVFQGAVRNLALAPSGAVVTGYPPTIRQTVDIAPQVYAATIMRGTTTNRRADLNATLNLSTVLPTAGQNAATIMRATVVACTAALGPTSINRVVSFQ